MRAVIQRVSHASVRVDGNVVGEISRGLLVLLGIGKDDTDAASDWLIKKLLALRIFPDEADKMNRSVTDIGGGILVVSQFTLYGELEKGTRPSFSTAMPPAEAREFYRQFMEKLRAATQLPVAEGQFGAMMDVELVNDGPVTIILESPVAQASSLSGSGKPPATGKMPVQPATFVGYDSHAPVAISRRELPHWRQPGRTYFVTFRLADSVPVEKLRQWEATPAAAREIQEYQAWLDQGNGACWLRQPAITGVVESALRHFDGDRYLLGDFVIMPNHVHVLVTPVGDHELSEILHSWKSYSANQINRLVGRTGKVWQDESFDHLVRTEHALQDFVEYIRSNPTRAGLRAGEFLVGQASSLSRPGMEER